MIPNLINFLQKFFVVVLMNCTTPENFCSCVRIDQWLLPDIKHYAPYVWGERTPYDTEKEILDTINN